MYTHARECANTQTYIHVYRLLFQKSPTDENPIHFQNKFILRIWVTVRF